MARRRAAAATASRVRTMPRTAINRQRQRIAHGLRPQPARRRPRARPARHPARAEDPGRHPGPRPAPAQRARAGAPPEGPPQHRLRGLPGPRGGGPRRAAARARASSCGARAPTALPEARGPRRDDPARPARRLPQGLHGRRRSAPPSSAGWPPPPRPRRGRGPVAGDGGAARARAEAAPRRARVVLHPRGRGARPRAASPAR